MTCRTIHTVLSAEQPGRAIEETVRVVRPVGRLVITDFRRTARHAQQPVQSRMIRMNGSRLGWRFCKRPWMAAHRPTATTRPARPLAAHHQRHTQPRRA